MKNRQEQSQGDPNRYPDGWNRDRVESLIEHYDGLSDDDWLAEDAAAAVNPTRTAASPSPGTCSRRSGRCSPNAPLDGGRPPPAGE